MVLKLFPGMEGWEEECSAVWEEYQASAAAGGRWARPGKGAVHM